jgi:DNA polymerase III alpha subunit (gram-positive type)
MTGRFLAYDGESGGLKAYSHGPASIAVVLFEDGKVIDSYSSLFKEVPSRGYCRDAFGVNGLSLEQLNRDGQEEADVYGKLGEWAAKHEVTILPIWAHNAEFDVAFYLDGMQRVKNYPLVGPWGCTKILSRKVWPNERNHDLNSVLRRLGMERKEEFHGALEDATLCGMALVRMLNLLGN